MAKSQQTWNKKEKEKKRQKKKEDKAVKKEERKLNTSSSSNLDSMIAYVDEYGNITDTPPDPKRKKNVIADSIQLGVPKREDMESEDPTKRGTVTFFDASKGYGFIKVKDSQDSYFTHINRHLDEIKEGNTVTFTVEQGQKGPVAVDVKIDK